NQDLKYAKFKDIQTIVQYWRLANTNNFWELVKQLHKTDEQIPKINDPQLYDKFLCIINHILLYSINKSSDPNKFVIDRSVKFSKYKFALQLYEKYSELIFSLIKLEKYYISISQQVPKKQKNSDKNNNNTSVSLKNLPKWM
ncbi:15991_t:CDS:2, partial [Gigaspora margarita]